jgi:Ran GTPase-activating protein (RanGAP) involved in mRNA processing and transport
LHTLNLSNNLLGKKGAAELSVLLQKNRTLTALDLSENTLGGSQMDSVVVLSKEQDGVVALAQSLAKNPSLLSLNLRGNRLAALATLGMKGKGQKNEFDVFGVLTVFFFFKKKKKKKK